jgi:oligopeptide/dipeptide ABC transporter ATP-binding protein
VVAAVRNVGLEVGRGEKVAIVGESGCGKSALALSILGLIEPPGRIVGGEVWLNGRDVSSLSDREMSRIRGREISLVFQDPMSALDPVKKIGNQITETIVRHQPGIGRKAARERAVELLREVEVPYAERRLDDYPHQYSGGMRQRVVIAIALANEPDVIIADEPTTALDVTTQAQVLDLLDRLVTQRQAAVILITHNLGIVAEFCDFVQVMYAGRIVEHASVEDLFERPLHPYTEGLLASLPVLDEDQQRLQAIPGVVPSPFELPPGCRFAPRCRYARSECNGADPALVPAPYPGGHEVACIRHWDYDIAGSV